MPKKIGIDKNNKRGENGLVNYIKNYSRFLLTIWKFEGRLSRRDVFRFWLPLILFLFMFNAYDVEHNLSGRWRIYVSYASLAVFWFSLFSVLSRRLHDQGKSPDKVLNYMGWLMPFNYTAIFEKGDEGPNKYGPPPN